MKTIQVFDPAMCCNTGVCGVDVDPSLVIFAADVDWAKQGGAQIERFSLSQQPMAFAENAIVKGLLQRTGQTALPVTLVDGQLALAGRYPSRDDLARWAGLRPQIAETNVPASCCADALHDDPLAAAIHAREALALINMSSELKALPQDSLALKPFNLVGLDALRHLLKDIPVPVTESTASSPVLAPKAPNLSQLVDDIAADGHGLVMLMGKGGVGKTTLAAAVAVELAHRGLPVHLTTSDPAAHLAQTLNGTLDNLTVSRIDPHSVTERYREHVLSTKGANLDAEGRAMLEEDLRSPCTEEIAVFQAFSRVIREAGKKFVVMDTAPTGHTLLLLDATGAYHRDIVRQMDETGVHFTTPMMQLQDPRQTKVLIVTLAETTPVLEAANLQADLRRAGIEPWAWVINNSLAACASASPLLQQRARNELREIDAVANRHAQRYALVPLLKNEPVGVQRLLDLAGHSLEKV